MKDYERVYLEQKGGFLSTKQLAKELGKTESTVKRWMKQLDKEELDNNLATVTQVLEDIAPVEPPPKKKRGPSISLYSRPLHKNNPAKPVGAIMTEAASMAGDDSKKVSTEAKNKYKTAIYQPFDDE